MSPPNTCILHIITYHRGENGIGQWSVVVKDTEVNESNGTFTDWRIKLWGECIDPNIQEPLPLPTEHDDDDHDVISGSPTFVSIDPGQPQPTSLPANPSDHPDRPVTPTSSATPVASPSPSATASETSTTLPDVPPAENTADEQFLPHFFPTFGVSKRTQIWIYGALAIILLFCLGLGLYFFIQRRKRRRSEREDYEFEELLDDEDATGQVGGKRTKRRAGELYDAFAGGSEDEVEGLLSDEGEAEVYRDDAPDEFDEKRGRRQSRGEDEEK